MYPDPYRFSFEAEVDALRRNDLWLHPEHLTLRMARPWQRPDQGFTIYVGRAVSDAAADHIVRAFDEMMEANDGFYPDYLPPEGGPGCAEPVELVELCTCGARVHAGNFYGGYILPAFRICPAGGLAVPLCLADGIYAARLVRRALEHVADMRATPDAAQ
jgi:hypothetical protein